MKLSRISRYARPAIQALFFIAFILLFLGLDWPAGYFDNALLAQDPLAALASLIFHKGAWLPSALVLVTIGASLLFGRVFCGWACPVGFLVDISGMLRRLIRRKASRKRLGYVQYGLLAAVLISSIFTLDLLSILDPFVVFQRTLEVLWSGSGIPLILILILAGSLAAPRLWCRICPAGAIYGLASLASPFPLKIGSSCIKCHKCHNKCPMGAISKDLKWDATACTKCLECQRICPESAITFGPSRPAVPSFESRRSFLAAGALLAGFVFLKGGASMVSGSTGDRLIRPPGSLAEHKFNAACVRCESCVKGCAGNVIKPLPLSAGLERAYTPYLDFTSGSCHLCGVCSTVCPTGAIAPIPVSEIKLGTASIDPTKCVLWKEGAACGICAEVCPVDAVKGIGQKKPRVQPDQCVGCGTCELHCPVKPSAVVVTNAGEKRR